MSLLQPAAAEIARPLLLDFMADHERFIARYDSTRPGWGLALVRRRILYSGTGATLVAALLALDAQMRAFPHGAPREVTA